MAWVWPPHISMSVHGHVSDDPENRRRYQWKCVMHVNDVGLDCAQTLPEAPEFHNVPSDRQPAMEQPAPTVVANFIALAVERVHLMTGAAHHGGSGIDGIIFAGRCR